MASLYIKDAQTAGVVARVAKRTGKTKTALVRELAEAHEAELDRAMTVAETAEAEKNVEFDRKLADFYRRFPPASPQVAPDHKPFFDAMWGEPD